VAHACRSCGWNRASGSSRSASSSNARPGTGENPGNGGVGGKIEPERGEPWHRTSALRSTAFPHYDGQHDTRSLSYRTDSTTAGPVTTTDPLTAIGIQTLSQAVEMLRQDVERERERASRAERQGEEGRKRIDTGNAYRRAGAD
jgi:hypothetical protein